jgi:NhaP-type Na+/H+ or K+/H+ antiporter
MIGFPAWVLALGLLLVVVHATGPLVARLPLSPAVLYFICGLALGPWGFDWLAVDTGRDGVWLERACELALLVSLFTTGSSVGSTLRSRHWHVPIRLATLAMLFTIAAISVLAYGWLGMSLGASIVLAAALAPTDPVLAGDVQVADARDRDRLRFGLTGEAGLNDGAALPFVLLGLGLLGAHDLGAWGWRWLAIDIAWAVAAGIALGALLGHVAGRFVMHRLQRGVRETGRDAFFGLGLVAIAYGIAAAAHANGFLAVFAAAMALQWTVAGPLADSPASRRRDGASPAQAEAVEAVESVRRFNSDLESLVEFGVVIVLGALFASVHPGWESLVLALVLFALIRPLAVWLAVAGVGLERGQRALAGWFGIRGVGSMYYAIYALNHDVGSAAGDRILAIVLGVVAASIFLHGISVTPLMSGYARRRARLQRPRATSHPGR